MKIKIGNSRSGIGKLEEEKGGIIAQDSCNCKLCVKAGQTYQFIKEELKSAVREENWDYALILVADLARTTGIMEACGVKIRLDFSEILEAIQSKDAMGVIDLLD